MGPDFASSTHTAYLSLLSQRSQTNFLPPMTSQQKRFCDSFFYAKVYIQMLFTRVIREVAGTLANAKDLRRRKVSLPFCCSRRLWVRAQGIAFLIALLIMSTRYLFFCYNIHIIIYTVAPCELLRRLVLSFLRKTRLLDFQLRPLVQHLRIGPSLTSAALHDPTQTYMCR